MSRFPIKTGVFVENTRIQPPAIEGVSTSNAAFLGETQTGPTTSTLITSFAEYQRIFGGYFGVDKYLPYAVGGFFGNGGKRCFVSSVNDLDYAVPWLNLKWWMLQLFTFRTLKLFQVWLTY
jgi:phage tail sheath protein FI